MRSSLFARLLLIFALLFAQMGSLAHGISHAVTDPSQNSDHSLPHNKHCDQCAAYAQLGSALGTNTVVFAPLKPQSDPIDALFDTQPSSAAFAAFAARAPPYSA